MRIATYMCPSEPNDRARITANITYYPNNYSFCQGTWFVYDPVGGSFGDGAFAPNFKAKSSDFLDGMSNTIGATENKAYQPNVWDTMLPATLNVPAPASPSAALVFVGSGTFDSNGHTEWVEGDVHETGITMTFPPNTQLPYTTGGATYDIDITSMRDGESITLPTYAAVTARSYHIGQVNALYMDGSVRSVTNGISIPSWRALGTRAGGETVGE